MMALMLFPFAVVVPVGVAVGIVLTSINAWVTLVLFGLISGMRNPPLFMCMCARARVCVCVCARTRASVCISRLVLFLTMHSVLFFKLGE
jgi:hypothetical protein